jgi:hypothetical protein
MYPWHVAQRPESPGELKKSAFRQQQVDDAVVAVERRDAQRAELARLRAPP